MMKPRGKVNRQTNQPVSGGEVFVFPPEQIEIGAWRPSSDDSAPPEQVHLILTMAKDLTMMIRFKSPDTIGFFIEELSNYRRMVWPEAEKTDTKSPAAALMSYRGTLLMRLGHQVGIGKRAAKVRKQLKLLDELQALEDEES